MPKKQLIVYEEKILEAIKVGCPDTTKVLRSLFGDQLTSDDSRVYCKKGDHFRIAGDEYVLARFEGSKMTLISIDSGNCWADYTEVNWTTRVTLGEFKRMLGSKSIEEVEKL